MGNIERKKAADYFLYERGLLEELKKYGQPHIIGSYKMDMMAWNDLDIDIENDNMSKEKLYELTSYIIKNFEPTWYEAKEEINEAGKRVWFQGFETMISGELWNFDLWFFDKETISEAEAFCDDIIHKVGDSKELKDIITKMKEELIKRGMYSFEQYRSVDVYRAVLEHKIYDVDSFIDNYKK